MAGTSNTATSGMWPAPAGCVVASGLHEQSFFSSHGFGAGFRGASRLPCEQQSCFGLDASAVVFVPQHPLSTRQQSGVPSAIAALAKKTRTTPAVRAI